MSTELVPESSQPRAVVLLSGGLDSSTAAAIAVSEGFAVHAMSFRYGQRHVAELDAARRVARRLNVADHVIVDIDLRRWGGSALTGDLEVPRDRPIEAMSADIPVTYVPARNTIFLSFALAWAETLHAKAIYLGVNALDYSGYPDCRPEYIAAYEAMANLATREKGMRIMTPLIRMTKSEIIARGIALDVDYGLTVSCYLATPDGRACGTCDSCALRLRGFAQNGMVDPAPYVL